MRKVIVKKRKMEKQFNNLKLIYLVYDICEVQEEDGTKEVNVSQIFEVIDIWNFEEANEIAGEALEDAEYGE